ncbi:MAG: methyltransferase domain-containing protein [Patescibacteria group bacterium]
MENRKYAFGVDKYSLLDNVIFYLRKRQVVKRIPTTAKIIADCGAGYDCRLLISLLNDTVITKAIAIDTEFKSELASVPNLTLTIANLNQPIPLADSSIDGALSLAVLEHLDSPEVFLKELYRIVRPGGVVLLTTPGPTSKPLLEFLAFRLGIIDKQEIADHKQYFSSEMLQAAFEEAGFTPSLVTPRRFLFGMNNIVMAIR